MDVAACHCLRRREGALLLGRGVCRWRSPGEAALGRTGASPSLVPWALLGRGGVSNGDLVRAGSPLQRGRCVLDPQLFPWLGVVLVFRL